MVDAGGLGHIGVGHGWGRASGGGGREHACDAREQDGAGRMHIELPTAT